jgi:prepilin-type processing-associated H-X9-DG protein/prepilin-type N-terminal cleavage/methylation domain-containing protein
MVRDTSSSRRHPRVRPPAAFTLVELLVVIGIIALLVGILLPTLGRARESANTVKCMANMRSMGQAMMIYVGESKGVLPIGYVVKNDVIDGNVTYQGESLDWTTLLMKVMVRKSGIGYDDQDKASAASTGTRSTFLCPTVQINSKVDSSAISHYSSHPRVIPDLTAIDWLRGGSPPRKLLPYKLAKIKRSAEVGAIFEGVVANTGIDGGYMAHSTCNLLNRGGRDRRPYLTDDYTNSATPIDPNTPVDLTWGGDGWNAARDLNRDTFPNRGNIRFRHKGDTVTNVLMFDGHVESFNFKKNTGKADLTLKNIVVPR